MLKSAWIAGLYLLLASLSVEANEVRIVLGAGQPTQQEFEVAAKRALYSRNYELWSIDQGIVFGKYQGQVEMALILTDKSVVIRNTDNGGRSPETIDKYLKNLERDLTYELAAFALVPTTSADAAKAKALLASAAAAKTVASESRPQTQHVITGKYRSEITSSNTYVFTKPSQRSPVIKFVQDGNKVTGVSETINLKISGKIDGDEISFFTWPSDITSYELKGTWVISEDGRRLTGKWTQAHGGGIWNLTKID